MEALDHKCPSCNANLKFDPTTQKWKCEYCWNSYTLKDLKKSKPSKNKLEYDESNITNNTKIEEISESKYTADDFNCYHCRNCGAKLVTDKTTSATFCVYCGNTSIIQERLENAFEPSKIIPFKTTKAEAISKFKEFKKHKWFAPKDFNNEKNIEKITGVYIPFWTYDCSISADLFGFGYKTRSRRSGDYIITDTDTYDVRRKTSANFIKVPVDGSKKFDDDTMDSIEPFDYTELVDFDISYLSGFLSECYDVNKEEAFTRANKRIENSLISLTGKTIHGYTHTTVNTFNADSDISDIKYFLLPVWMLNINYNDKKYLFAMNGQTGKMVGDIPVSKSILASKWLLFTLVAFTILLLASIILTISSISIDLVLSVILGFIFLTIFVLAAKASIKGGKEK